MIENPNGMRVRLLANDPEMDMIYCRFELYDGSWVVEESLHKDETYTDSVANILICDYENLPFPLKENGEYMPFIFEKIFGKMDWHHYDQLTFGILDCDKTDEHRTEEFKKLREWMYDE